MRARIPDQQGHVDRDGVRIHYEVHGSGSVTILLLPAFSFCDSKMWKNVYAYLSRWFRVVMFDPRGSAASDTPAGGWEAYADAEWDADIIAVLDATGTEAAVVAGQSMGGLRALRFAADFPGRVLGTISIAPFLAIVSDPAFTLESYEADLDGEVDSEAQTADAVESTDPPGSSKAHLERPGGFDRFFSWFIQLWHLDPNSSWPTEDQVGWSREIPPSVTLDTVEAVLRARATSDEASDREMLQRISSPVLLLHAADDLVTPLADSEAIAEIVGAELVVLDGVLSHDLLGRHPVPVCLEIRRFAESLYPPPARRRPSWRRALSRPRRVLYLSSAIGLGHARRDLAIADELRKLQPEAEVDWLTQHPVTAMLEQHEERVHPASAHLASESAHIESEAGEHDLHCFQAIREMDQILVNNFMVLHDLLEAEHYDLVVADEAWEVDHFLREHPELKRAPLAWLTDFDGFLPMPDGGEHEARVAAEHNAYVIEGIERFTTLRDRAIFVGDPDDIVPLDYGPDLPQIRPWVEEHYEFSGYVTGFDPINDDERAVLRADLGYRDDETICIVTVGGSGVGAPLLQTMVAAHKHAARLIPGLRTVVVTGPRIDPRSIPEIAGLDVHGYVPDLHRHLAVCDVAVVQGGLTTCMELTTNQRPFLYFPLGHHFEQNIHVRHRLDRYRAGRYMDYASETPESIAHALAEELGREVDYLPVEADGAARAAASLSELL